MSELNYQLLTKEEQGSCRTIDQRYREKHASPIKKVIDRFTLPEPTDAIGKKKELVEKIHFLILIGTSIAAIIGVFIFNYQSYPEISSYINSTFYQNNENEENNNLDKFPLPVLGFCFPTNVFSGWSPVVWRMTLRENFHANQTATCVYWSPAGQFNLTHPWPTDQVLSTPTQNYTCDKYEIMNDCNDVVTINRDQQCVAFGNEKCPLWQTLRKHQVVEIQLLGFWSSITQFPTTSPGGWYDNQTTFFDNPNSYHTQVLLGGISQAILEFHRAEHKIPDPDDWRPWKYITNVSYPTSITTLNLLDNHFQCSQNRSILISLLDLNEMCYLLGYHRATKEPFYSTPNPFSVLELQIRLKDTKIPTTKQETKLYFIYRSLKDIGGFLTTVAKILFILISIGLTRILFSNRNAFFDEEIRLAVTHFIRDQLKNKNENKEI